ncbi:dienelactone hydrolase family protein [Azotobacter chroococcum]|uniref:dienelactone hydrolase family protein n=1 Tax=Azotobacter chroococcum TaxID=353 RepID=UPI0010395BF4|nr:dienelactone hydrolase family protein [Azotobacter chroococcum]TBW37913.1 dienelactone hydrolase family protein [Azotobacter chroococcum]
MGSTLQIEAGDGSGRFTAYVALPPGGHGPAVVIGQEIFGVNANIRAVADRYATEGYVAIAPDLFWRLEAGVELGYAGADREKAFALFGRFDVDKGIADIGATLDAARRMPEVDAAAGAGFVGFCLGGRLAYLTAARSDIACAVGYYGVGIEHLLDEAASIRGRLVLHIAEADAFCPAEARAAVLAGLGGRPNIELYSYPGCEHAFARTGSRHYDQAAAELAHQRSLVALHREIGPR